MDFNHLLPILLALLCPLVAVEGGHASETPLAVLYWQSVLPNVPLPDTLQQLVYNSAENKGNFLNGHQYGKEQAKFYPDRSKFEVPHSFDAPPRLFSIRSSKFELPSSFNPPPRLFTVGKKKFELPPSYDPPPRLFTVGKRKFELPPSYDPPTRLFTVGKRKFELPPSYDSPPRLFTVGNSESKLKRTANNSNTTLFFLNTDLLSGKTFNFRFTDMMDHVDILPRQVADSIPFSTKNLQEIFNHFSVNPNSIEAEYMKTTLDDCEASKLDGEDKYCATSLESLVDHAVARFGKKVLVLSNEVDEKNKEQKYKVLKGIKLVGEEQIVCHKEIYAYAVFYCHKLKASKFYKVPLLGANGKKANALVICHEDTSAWNPNHMAFKLLNVKPGGPSICHILHSDTIVWVH